jgi:hypothetical protein
MKLLRVLVLVLVGLQAVEGLYFGITGKPFCFDIEQEPGKTIKFFYEVTGEKPQETQVHIVSSNQNSAVSLTGANNKTEQSADFDLNVCFVSTDGGYKSVSVDFYTHDKAHLLELAKKSEIYELHTKLVDVGEGLKEITKNELFEEQRQIIHAEIISAHESKVKNFAIVKLLAIVIVAVGQLYLLKKMLDKQGQGYQGVPSS